MPDPITIAVTGKKIFDIGSDIFGDKETSDLTDLQRKTFFNGHHDRVRERYTKDKFFRWSVLPQNDGSGGWGKTEQGKAEINQIINGGSIMDAYYALFVYQNTTKDSTVMNRLKSWVEKGQGELSHSPKSEQRITKWKLDNLGNIVLKQNTQQSIPTQNIQEGFENIMTSDISIPIPEVLKKGSTPFIIGGVILGLTLIVAVVKK